MSEIYLNIGSNRGDREANIELAVALIAEHWHGARVRRAPIVESDPAGFDSPNRFLNLGVAIDTADRVDPYEVLDALQAIERRVAPNSPHRNDDGSYRDRDVDIDIIAIDDLEIESERLTLPHPRAAARDFVMRPMRFLRPGWEPRGGDAAHAKKTVFDMNRDTVSEFRAKKKLRLVVILDNIRSLNNIGSIFRTSDAFLVECIDLCGITAQPPSQEIHKTALGAEDSVAWTYHADTLDAVSYWRERGYQIACLEQVHDSVSLERFSVDRDSAYAIIVGNEVNGVDPAVVRASDHYLEIPQHGTKHSLNVSTSTAIALWHFFVAMR